MWLIAPVVVREVAEHDRAVCGRQRAVGKMEREAGLTGPKKLDSRPPAL